MGPVFSAESFVSLLLVALFWTSSIGIGYLTLEMLRVALPQHFRKPARPFSRRGKGCLAVAVLLHWAIFVYGIADGVVTGAWVVIPVGSALYGAIRGYRDLRKLPPQAAESAT
jgi:hypothetical protein